MAPVKDAEYYTSPTGILKPKKLLLELRRARESADPPHTQPFSCFVSAWIGLKVSTPRAEIVISAPVFGLRPMRSFFCLTVRFPAPACSSLRQIDFRHKKAPTGVGAFLLVRKGGLEPPRPCDH